MHDFIDVITSNKFNSQEEFDAFHRLKTIELCELNSPGYKLTIGQAQKWINMTLKNLLILGDKRISQITLNYKYFHIPIDNIIQDRFQISPYFLRKRFPVWSQIPDYENYLEYQKEVRKTFKNEIPIEVELAIFNK